MLSKNDNEPSTVIYLQVVHNPVVQKLEAWHLVCVHLAANDQ
jgi:hypothetical protein